MKSLIRANKNKPALLTNTSAFGFGAKVEYHGTTILNVRKGNQVCMIGDGQISLGHTVFK